MAYRSSRCLIKGGPRGLWQIRRGFLRRSEVASRAPGSLSKVCVYIYICTYTSLPWVSDPNSMDLVNWRMPRGQGTPTSSLNDPDSFIQRPGDSPLAPPARPGKSQDEGESLNVDILTNWCLWTCENYTYTGTRRTSRKRNRPFIGDWRAIKSGPYWPHLLYILPYLPFLACTLQCSPLLSYILPYSPFPPKPLWNFQPLP